MTEIDKAVVVATARTLGYRFRFHKGWSCVFDPFGNALVSTVNCASSLHAAEEVKSDMEERFGIKLHDTSN